MPLPLTHLLPHEAAFILQRHPIFRGSGPVSEQVIRSALRRSERLSAEKQLSDDEILRGSRPSVPVTYDGAGRRRVPVWAVRELVVDDALASAFLDAVVERRLRCPRTARPADPVPRFYAWLRWL